MITAVLYLVGQVGKWLTLLLNSDGGFDSEHHN